MSQLLKDSDRTQVIPYHVNLPYPHLRKSGEGKKKSIDSDTS